MSYEFSLSNLKGPNQRVRNIRKRACGGDGGYYAIGSRD